MELFGEPAAGAGLFRLDGLVEVSSLFGGQHELGRGRGWPDRSTAAARAQPG